MPLQVLGQGQNANVKEVALLYNFIGEGILKYHSINI
jgi:hypothetical protein